MKKKLPIMWDSVSSEFKAHTAFYLLLITIFLLAFWVRVYRVNDLLQFYYDQGRDALVIWDFWHKGKFFLIGPVTGLAGIFLGPLYYYSIAPFYLIGGGNPIYPAVFLSFLSVVALVLLYLLGKDMHSRFAGILAVFIGSFSYFIFTASRWLSNPTPTLLTSVVLLWLMWRITERSMFKFRTKSWHLILSALVIGLSLQFESASAVFYVPMFMVFIIWHYCHSANILSESGRKKILNKIKNDIKPLFIALLVFFATLLPQIIFNFRHENILFNNFQKMLFEEKSFHGLTKFLFEEKIKFFWSVFSTKIFAGKNIYSFIFILFSMSSLITFRSNFKKGLLKLFFIFITIPLICYTFFHGNFGHLYDYYLTGYYLPFVLIFSIGIAQTLKSYIGKIVLVVFIFLFIQEHTMLVKSYLTATPSTRPIAIEDQMQAVNWVYSNASMVGEFNLDIYVPPVIPYSYDYLFLWQGILRQKEKRVDCKYELCGLVKDSQNDNLFLLYEDDPPNPDRLDVWLKKYENNSRILKSDRFGGINVEQRVRITGL